MEYQNRISRLRHAFLKIQGQDLTQVLLRAAAKEAEGIAKNVYTTEEIFRAITDKIYEATNELSYNTKFELVSDLESLSILKRELIEDVIEPFQWDETLHTLLEGLEGTERSIIKAVLNNQHSYCSMESGMIRGSTAPSDGIFSKLLVPIARRIFRNFEALKLVGVQPMTGPVSLAYLLRYQQKNDDGKYEDVDPAEMGERKITLSVISQAIEAQSRRLNAGWTLEASQDLNAMHGLDIESEMIQALAAEIQEELTAEIVGNLRKLAGDPEEIELDGLDLTAPSKLSVTINRMANDIAVKTRRAAGNWIVVSPIMVSLFEKGLPEGTYKKKEDGKFGLFGSLMEVGTLNGTIKVFSSWSTPADEILVGYKGGNGETDTGYVYAPYIPVMSAGIVVDSETFQPLIKLMTRNGMTLNGNFQYDEDGNKLDIPPHAQNYYNLIKIKGNLFTETDSSGEDS